ncbi:unnamed protein product, partial [Brachionus calyciflorus]
MNFYSCLKNKKLYDKMLYIKTIQANLINYGEIVYVNPQKTQTTKIYGAAFDSTKSTLDNLHVSAFQDFISARYPLINRFLSPDIYLLGRPMCNPDVLSENILSKSFMPKIIGLEFQITIQFLNQMNYAAGMYTTLINGGSRYMTICHIPVVQQIGYDDCGLFALGFALALAIDIDPGSIYFDQ